MHRVFLLFKGLASFTKGTRDFFLGLLVELAVFDQPDQINQFGVQFLGQDFSFFDLQGFQMNLVLKGFNLFFQHFHLGVTLSQLGQYLFFRRSSRQVLVLIQVERLFERFLFLKDIRKNFMEFLKPQARTQNSLVRLKLSRLDTLGDRHFFLAGQQRDSAHLMQIHFYRVADTRFNAGGLQYFFELFILVRIRVIPQRVGQNARGFPLLVGNSGFFFFTVHELNVILPQHEEDVVYLLRRDQLVRQDVIDLFMGDITLFFSLFENKVLVIGYCWLHSCSAFLDF